MPLVFNAPTKAKAKFVVGKVYAAKSPGDQDCVWVFKVTKRTDKTITIDGDGVTAKNRMIKVNDEKEEYAYPLGIYSMCPVLRATKVFDIGS